MLTDTIHVCHSITFTVLNLSWGSQSQFKAKPPVFIFSHSFQVIRLKFDLVLKHF